MRKPITTTEWNDGAWRDLIRPLVLRCIALERRAEWAELLARAAERGLWKWSRPGVVVVAKDRFNEVCECKADSHGLPVEIPDLRAAIEAARGGEK